MNTYINLRKCSYTNIICITITNLYCKPTDSYQYLHYDLCHADHIKRSIIFSQTL